MPRSVPLAARSSSRRALLAGVAASGVALLFGTAAHAQEASPAGDPLAMLPPDPDLPAGEPRAEGPLRVIATTGILADLVRQVGGQRVDAHSVLPANADPHDFEPTPQDVAAIGEADLLVEHGLGLDSWAGQLIAASPGTPLITASDGVELRHAHAHADEDHEDDGHGHDHEGEDDPHWWFDPTRAATAVQTITAGLTAADPAGEATYRARADAYAAFLLEMDAAIAAAIATIPPERRRIVTNHDALGYYADRYGLEVVGTVIPGLATTAEPSAAEVAALLDAIAASGVPAIFAETTTSPRLAESLAAEAGIVVIDDLYTDTLGEPGSGADTYAGLLRTDTAIVVEALR